MQTGEPSKTAIAVAWARADHQTLDEPRIFTDPLAAKIVGPPTGRPEIFDTALDPDRIRTRRLLIAARSRFADDTVAAAVAAGTRQVVVLGAGLDTSAYRNPHPDVHFFEVDHPDTQAWKRTRLAEASIAIPGTLSYAPVDFERESLADGLAAAGFDRARPALFLWLGVVMYLTAAAIESTLSYIAGQGGGGEVVFDFLAPAVVDAAAQRERAERVAAVGEPWLTARTAEEYRAQLHALGFTRVEVLFAVQAISGYSGRPDPGPADGPGLIHASTV
ncbi:methyltransferase (TIGR00027 family) [Nocardia sp. GAS34]|uniref:class I SAM-dependent methyltransferase n=1 Tax=unclassified Nocardia TaxID=2637762 RepID=UPI003D1AF1A2